MEWTLGWVVFNYLSDYLDTHHQIVLNFKPTDMDIKWLATDWHWSWCPSVEHAGRLSHSLECRAAGSTDMLCSTLGCLALINQNSLQYGCISERKNNAQPLEVLGGSSSAEVLQKVIPELSGALKHAFNERSGTKRAMYWSMCLRTLIFC